MTHPIHKNGESAAEKDRISIFDTTLRDGEQCPGATMTFEDKLEVARLLDAMGVDIIEAGFPIASEGDFEAVAAIAKRTKRARVAGLARAIERDIARAGEAVRAAVRPRIHTFVSTSPIHLAHQMNKSAGGRARHHRQDGDAGAQSRRRCRMVGDGCDAHADRLSLPLCRDGDQGGRNDDQPARYRRLCHAKRICGDVRGGPHARAECRQSHLLGSLPRRSRPCGCQYTGWRRRRARGRSNARSTGSASVPAMRRSKKS